MEFTMETKRTPRGAVYWTATASARTGGNNRRTVRGQGRTPWLALAEAIAGAREAEWLETWDTLPAGSEACISTRLVQFVTESNLIEGIHRPPTEAELLAHALFLSLKEPDENALSSLVEVLQPGARLRTGYGMDVRVSNHVPEPGGPRVLYKLTDLLCDATLHGEHPARVYQRYEHLHPFTDGNGRSGRALWAWCQIQQGRPDDFSSFLRAYHYQTLELFDLEGY